MSKIKELWQYNATFRWCVYQTILAAVGFGAGVPIAIWVLIFILPAVWVWKKVVWKKICNAIDYLNWKAGSG